MWIKLVVPLVLRILCIIFQEISDVLHGLTQCDNQIKFYIFNILHYYAFQIAAISWLFTAALDVF